MLAAWCGASAWTSADSLGRLGLVPWCNAASIFTGILLWVSVARATRPLGAIAVTLTAGLLGAIAGGNAAVPASLRDLAEYDGGLDGPWRVQGSVVREPVGTGRGSTAIIDVDHVWLQRQWRSLRGRVEIEIPEAPPRPNWYSGTRLEAWLRLRPDRPPANPAGAATDRLRARGIDLRSRLKSYGQLRLRAPPASYVATIPGRARDLVRDRIGATFERHPELIRALVLGERRDLDEGLVQGLARSGLVHLLAISGLHVGVLAMVPMGALRALGRSPRASWCAGLGATLLLVSLVEPRAPIQRAATMASSLFVGRLTGRRVASSDALGVAVVVIVAAEPGALWQFGFQLSVAATAGILLADRRAERPLLGVIGSSLVANGAVAPLLALQIGAVPVAGLVLNVVAIPAVSAALVLAVGALVGSISAVSAVSGGFSVAAETMLDLVLACSRAPAYWGAGPVAVAAASVPLAALYGLGMIIACRAGGRVRAVGALSAMTAVVLSLQSPPIPTHPRLLALDVGQGDAQLLVSADGAVLIDAGGYPGIDYDTGYHIVEPELRRLGVTHIDAVAVTHDHADHVAGVPAILRHFRIAELWQGATPLTPGPRPFYTSWLRHETPPYSLPLRSIGRSPDANGAAFQRQSVNSAPVPRK
ncbi:MAG TPA: ComEC/Rec2 family competence protein [Acidobacteriota bacterium]|nr:ComEC/Rec2 family competence protein [Acidobacteriota bacterium]